MLVLSLRTQLEELASGGSKANIGNIRSFDAVFSEENLARLEQRHDGVFAFVAFHPSGDSAVAEYVAGGTMVSDTGPRVLALFTLNANATWGTVVDPTSLVDGLEFSDSIHPSYEVVRRLFEPMAPPPLPGAVFFDRLVGESEALFSSLQGIHVADEMRERMRTLFSAAEVAFDKSRAAGRPFGDTLAVTLEKQRIPVVLSGKVSMRQWLVRAYKFVGDNYGDIVSTVALAV
jgi:hypothetical protein